MTRTDPLLLSAAGNRNLATDLVRNATEMPEPAAHALILTVDAISGAALRAAAIGDDDAREILAALWTHRRLTDAAAARAPEPRVGTAEADRAFLLDVGQRIHVLRRVRRVSAEDIYRTTGIPPTHLRNIERGQTTATTVTLRRLAGALQVSPAVLLDTRVTPERVLAREASCSA